MEKFNEGSFQNFEQFRKDAEALLKRMKMTNQRVKDALYTAEKAEIEKQNYLDRYIHQAKKGINN